MPAPCTSLKVWNSSSWTEFLPATNWTSSVINISTFLYFSLNSLFFFSLIAVTISLVKVSDETYSIFFEGSLSKTLWPIACIRWVFPRPTPPYKNRGLSLAVSSYSATLWHAATAIALLDPTTNVSNVYFGFRFELAILVARSIIFSLFSLVLLVFSWSVFIPVSLVSSFVKTMISLTFTANSSKAAKIVSFCCFSKNSLDLLSPLRYKILLLIAIGTILSFKYRLNIDFGKTPFSFCCAEVHKFFTSIYQWPSFIY